MVLMVGMSGSGGLAPLFLRTTLPVLSVTVILEARLPVRVTSLHAVITSRVCVFWLTEGSPRARLAVFRPVRIIVAAGSGGMTVSAVAPLVAWGTTRVSGPAVEQGGGGVTFGEIGAHLSLPRARQAK